MKTKEELIKEAAEHKAETLEKKAGVAKAELNEKIDDVKIGAATAAEKADSKWENFKDKAEDAWENTKDKAENAWENTKDKAKELWEDTKDKAEDVSDRISNRPTESENESKKRVS